MSRYKTARSFTPDKAKEILPVVKEFHYMVRRWIADVPLHTGTYMALSVLNSVLMLFLCELQGDADAIQRFNLDGGPSE